VAEVLLWRVEGGDGVGLEHAASGVEVVGDMVQENALQGFLGWLLVVLGNLLKSLVGGGEDGVVCLGAVEELDEVVVLVDELCKLRGVFAFIDELLMC
jgi:hypothetical protein